MRRLRLVLACALALAATACAHKSDDVSARASLPPMLIDDRGIVMPLEDALTKHLISYKPWIPPRQILKFAVIPPLGDLDTPDHRGIAIEYQFKNQAMLLSEWPKQNFTLLFLHGEDITLTPCKVAHYKADGAAWTTKTKLAMTLQPDGNVSSKDVDAEAQRLIASGACS
jgi:hypothetical protein